MAALTVLGIASTPNASAHRPSVALTDQASAQTPVPISSAVGACEAVGVEHRTLGPAGTASPWTPLKNPPPFGTPGTMLLESDGTVLVHDEPDNNTTGGTNAWYKLTPDSKGSYIDGTWSQIASMPAGYTPLYFASAILPDGRMIVEGGEYIGENAVWSNKGAIYNPVTNTWASVAPPPGWTNIGDAASDVLANGTFMLQHPCKTCLTNPDLTVDDALLNAKTLTWTVIPGTGKNDPNDEEGWTLEPSGQLLTVDTWVPPADPAIQPGHRVLVIRGKHGRERQSCQSVPGRRDRAAGRDARRQHVCGRGGHEHARAAHGVHHGRGDADRAVPVQGRDRGHVDRGAGDPGHRRRRSTTALTDRGRSCRMGTCCST